MILYWTEASSSEKLQLEYWTVLLAIFVPNSEDVDGGKGSDDVKNALNFYKQFLSGRFVPFTDDVIVLRHLKFGVTQSYEQWPGNKITPSQRTKRHLLSSWKGILDVNVPYIHSSS